MNAEYSDDDSALSFFSTDSRAIIEKLVSVIDNAEESISLCASSVDNTDIVNALIRARSRFVDVKVVIDSRSVDSDGAITLLGNSVPVHSRAYDSYMGSFFLISDDRSVAAGAADLRANRESSICSVFYIHSEDLADHYSREFYILETGQSPAQKDVEFDQKLGPFGDKFSISWYTDNQIFTVLGTSKGIWDRLSVKAADLTLRPYFTPYGMTEFDYGFYVQSEPPLYDFTERTYTFYDYDRMEEVQKGRTDFINVIAPLIEGAVQTIVVAARALTDPILIDRLVRAYKRGVAVNIYFDYDMTINHMQIIPRRLKALAENSTGMYLTRMPAGNAFMANSVIVDDTLFIVSSSGFTENLFKKNDGAILFIRGNDSLYQDYMKMMTRLAAFSKPYSPDETYGEYVQYKYFERM